MKNGYTGNGFENVLKEELSGLTKEQRSAVMHGEGGALCLAGPGSGKTRVISLRAARLWDALRRENAQNKGKNAAGSVLTLSFNKAACEEMRSRGLSYIETMGGQPESREVGFYTVHAYCFKLLRDRFREKGIRPPKVLSTEETAEIIEKLYGDLSGGRTLPRDAMKELISYITTENAVPDFDFGGLDRDMALEIEKRYKKVKENTSSIDFGDMLGKTLAYLKTDPEFREKTRAAYRYTQVDEAQDLSRTQAEILKLMTNGNVFYVADDDQSIYGFRGANPDMLRTLGKGGEGFKTYVLDKNFRSGSEIVGVSSRFIKANDDRFAKRISSERTGGEVSLRYFKDTKAQAKFCADLLKRRKKQGRSACVLYRNNVSALPVAAELFLSSRRDPGAAVHVKGGRIRFSDLDYVTKLAEELEKLEKKAGTPFFSPLPWALYAGLKSEKRVDMIAAECFGGKRPFMREAAVTAAEILLKSASSAKDFLRLAEGTDRFCEGGPDSLITLSTVHSAKGLEYDTVVIIDCVEGEFPFGDIRSEAQLREERRLMYVAMTRAKNRVTVSFPGKCGKIELTASRFVDEIQDGS